MTAATFQQKIKDIYKPDYRYSKWSAWLLLGVNVCFYLWLLWHIWRSQGHRPWELLIIPAVFSLFVGYATWCWKQAYRIHQFDSSKTILEKTAIIGRYIADLKVVWHYTEGNYHSITYRNRLFMRVDLRLYIDQHKILANLQRTSRYIIHRKNHLDLGLAQAATKKLKKYLEAHL